MKFSFKPRARLIKQLGEQLIANEKIAVSELIKNAYDACATKVKISFQNIDKKNGRIIIEDNGRGMNIDIVKDSWLEIGSDYKEHNKITECGRYAIGEKGIGRFGVHKLGNKIKLITKMKNFDEVEINIDWNKFESVKYLEEYPIEIKINRPSILFQDNGTFIEISSLKKKWEKNDIRSLYRDIISLKTPPFEKINKIDNFNIEFEIDNNWLENLPSFEDIKKAALWHFYVKIEEVNGIMEITDFQLEFRPYSYMSKISSINRSIKEIEKDKKIRKHTSKKAFEYIKSFGVKQFEMEGYIFYLDTTILKREFSEIQTIKKYLASNGGVRVYRDGLRVYNYGEKGDDWLELDKTRINAPTSSISNRTILAVINLSKKYSEALEEKTNREGFVENKAFEKFKESILYTLGIINKFVNEDKNKIKKIYLLEEKKLEADTITILDEIQTKIEKKNLIQDEKERQKILKDLEKAKQYYIEVRDNLLKSAGVGLSYALITHEIEKIIGSLYLKVKNQDSELKRFIEHLKEIVENLTKIFTNDKLQYVKIKDIVDRSLLFFRHRFDFHNIIVETDVNEDLEVKCIKNMIVNALMNLYDNSLFWFKFYKEELKSEGKDKKILIFTKDNEEYVDLVVCDSGFGFNISPESAKLPFVTGKPPGFGMGLGLYFVDEVLKRNNAELIIVNNKEKLEYNIPEEYKNGAIVIFRFFKKETNE